LSTGSNEATGASLASYLDSAALGSDIIITTSLYTGDSNLESTRSSALASFQTLLALNCRIFVLHSTATFVNGALLAAKDLNLLDNSRYVILSTPDWSISLSPFVTPTDALRGVTGIAQSLPRTSSYQSWRTRMPLLWSNDTRFQWSRTPVQLGEALFYDGLVYYAQSIANVLAAGLNVSGPNLLDAMHSLSGVFTGAIGVWKVTNHLLPYLLCAAHFQLANTEPTVIVCAISLIPILIYKYHMISFNGRTIVVLHH
jgi:hypothetical protein